MKEFDIRMNSDIHHDDEVTRHRREHARKKAEDAQINRRRRFGRYALAVAASVPLAIFAGGPLLGRGLDQIDRDGRPPKEVVQHLTSVAPLEYLSDASVEDLEK